MHGQSRRMTEFSGSVLAGVGGALQLPAPLAFRPIASLICSREPLGVIGERKVELRQTDTGACYEGRPFPDRAKRVQSACNLIGNRLDAVGWTIRQDNCELIAAQARHYVGMADGAAQDFRNPAQHPIACRVAPRIVTG